MMEVVKIIPLGVARDEYALINGTVYGKGYQEFKEAVEADAFTLYTVDKGRDVKDRFRTHPLKKEVRFKGCVSSRIVANNVIHNSSRPDGSSGFRIIWRLLYDIDNHIDVLDKYGLGYLRGNIRSKGYRQIVGLFHCCYNYHKTAKYHTFQSFVDAGGLIEGSGVKDSV